MGYSDDIFDEFVKEHPIDAKNGIRHPLLLEEKLERDALQKEIDKKIPFAGRFFLNKLMKIDFNKYNKHE